MKKRRSPSQPLGLEDLLAAANEPERSAAQSATREPRRSMVVDWSGERETCTSVCEPGAGGIYDDEVV